MIPGCTAIKTPDQEPGPRDTVHSERMRSRDGILKPSSQLDQATRITDADVTALQHKFSQEHQDGECS